MPDLSKVQKKPTDYYLINPVFFTNSTEKVTKEFNPPKTSYAKINYESFFLKLMFTAGFYYTAGKLVSDKLINWATSKMDDAEKLYKSHQILKTYTTIRFIASTILSIVLDQLIKSTKPN